MGVRILDRKYGNAFAPITEPKPDWLIGNVGDWLRLNMIVEAGVDFLASQSDPISINKEERSIKIMNGKKWSDYGFDLGASITLTFKVDTTDEDGVVTTETVIIDDLTIEQLFNDTLIYESNDDMNDLVPYETIPTDRGQVRVYSVKVFDDRDVQGVRMKYANVDNSQVESHLLTSFIDGTETEAIYAGLQNITQGSGWQNMTLINKQSGMSIESAMIRKVGAQNLPIYAQLSRFATNIFNLECWKIFGQVHKRDAWAIPINLNIPQPQFQAVTNTTLNVSIGNTGVYLGQYMHSSSNRMFYYNSPDNHTKQFDFMFRFRTWQTNKNDPNCYLALVLLRYKDGTALNFGGRTELKRWTNSEISTGATYEYNDTVIQSINTGDSFTYALEWNHEALNSTTRYLRVQPFINLVNVYDLADGITSYKKKYEIQLDFMLSSFFEQITDLETNSAPQVVFNANSLTDAIKLTFLPEWNNPNIKIENDMTETERLGNTGWFNENYNGLPNHFQVKSLQYTDLAGQPATALSYGSDMKVRAVIGGIPNLSVDSDFKHGFIWLPIDEAQYKDKLTPFHKNTKISSNFSVSAFNANQLYPNTYDGYAEDNAKMNTRAISYTISGNDLIFEAVFSPTPDFLQYFLNKDGDRKYALWVSVADRTLETNFSDRVSLLLDVNNMDFFIPISGKLDGVINTFLEHPEDHLATGVEVYDGFLEDDILARSFFGLEFGKRLNQVVLGFEVENLNTGVTYELERFVANLQSYPSTPPLNIHQVNFNSQRGYKMEPNFNKNWVKVVRNTGGDGNGKAGYQILFGQKIRWEYWLQKTGVPPEFYDHTLQFDGSNNDWLHYLRTSNTHNINYFILFDVLEGGQLKRYKNTYPIIFNGYDENVNFETTHQYFNNATDELLDAGTETETGRPLGVLLSNENTRIEITYKKLNGNISASDVYCVTTLEINKGAGVMTHRQLSSIVGSEIDNILIPLPPNTKLKVEQISPNTIKATCLVDFTRLSPAYMYKITGRIGCFPNNDGVPVIEKIYDTNDYENNYE